MDNFPLGVHIVFIPLTIAAGFVLGWVCRGVAGRPPRKSEPPPDRPS